MIFYSIARWVVLAAMPLTLAAANPVAAPNWMAGEWTETKGDQWTEEYWTGMRGGIMIGAARSGKGEKLESWESTRIAYDENGKLAFWAMPGGAPASKFPMVSQTDSEIVFANAAHDYPQRIRYWREGKELKAEISLIDGSKPYRFTYMPMRQ